MDGCPFCLLTNQISKDLSGLMANWERERKRERERWVGEGRGEGEREGGGGGREKEGRWGSGEEYQFLTSVKAEESLQQKTKLCFTEVIS